MPRPSSARCATRIADLAGAYLDTSVLVPLLTVDALTDRARAWGRTHRLPWILSDLAKTEFAAAITRKLRTRDVNEGQARHAFAALDSLGAAHVTRARIDGSDLTRATAWIRRLALPLRAPDAIHLAAAQRLGAEVVTLDAGMAAAGQALGLAIAGA